MINIGDTIDNRYNVVKHLGTGGMAVVFECKDLITGRDVAVKILKEELLGDKFNEASFKKEVKTEVTMSHPNIIKVYEDGVFENRPYLVMEYLIDQTLLDKLEYFTKFSLLEACQIMIQLLDAIEYTHQHGVIHCDIKPQNIFYMPNGTIKLVDFGIASNEKDGSFARKILGSVHFLAPEVLIGKPCSVASDVYAAGITFFQLLTGRLPFDGNTAEIADAQIKKPMPKVSKINTQIPCAIDDIICKATCKEIRGRFKSAKEFKIAIENFQSGKTKKKSIFSRIFG